MQLHWDFFGSPGLFMRRTRDLFFCVWATLNLAPLFQISRYLLGTSPRLILRDNMSTVTWTGWSKGPEWDKATVCSGVFLSGSPYVCTVALTPFHCRGTEINKTMRTVEKKKKKPPGGGQGVFLESLRSDLRNSNAYFAPHFREIFWRGIKMTGLVFWANLKEPFRLLKVLPNYRFLSLGRSGMRFKMDYVPTLALVASIFFIVLLLFLKKKTTILSSLLLSVCFFLQVSFSPV